ncbi:MAG: protease complex subunit PrcB family protein [Candidatus Firestonebacteria bacterium]
MDKNCKDILELLSSYLENDLDEKKMIEVKHHLSICKKCKKEYESLCKTVGILKNLPKYTAPSSILAKVNKKIQERKPFWEKLSPFGFKISLGTVSLIIITLVSFQLYRYISINSINEQKITKKETIKKLEKKIMNNLKKDISGELKESERSPQSLPAQDKVESSTIEKQGVTSAIKESLRNEEGAGNLKNKDALLGGGRGMMFDARQGEEFNELKGTMCNFKERKNLIIKTNVEWEEVWKKTFSDKEIPKIDFDKKMAILVFAGEKMTGGYEISIKEINYEKDKIIVKISEIIPPRNAFCIMVITSPFYIKIIDKSDLPVEFK